MIFFTQLISTRLTISNKSRPTMLEHDITIIKSSAKNEDEKSLEVRLKEESIRDQTKRARELFKSIQNELDESEEDLKDGLSFLDLKNDTLLSYMIDLCNIMLRKVRSETISGHQSVERCVFYRVVIEKIKAIDQRLAYQLNKIITMPENAEEDEQRVDVNNLDIEISSDEGSGKDSNKEEEEDEDSSESAGEDDSSGQDEDLSSKAEESDDADDKVAQKKSAVYKPPKLRSVAYSEENDRREKRKNYDDFYRDNDDEADIVDELPNRREELEREKFEEEHYTRFADSNKAAKRKLKAAKPASKKFKSGGGSGKSRSGGGGRGKSRGGGRSRGGGGGARRKRGR